MRKNIEKNEIWTKVPYKIKYEYGFTWISVIFSLLASIQTFKKYNEKGEFIVLVVFLLSSLFFILFMYKRFIKNTAVILSKEGIEVFPLLRSSYFVPWSNIEKFYLMSRGHMGTIIRVKAIYFIYKKEYMKDRIFDSKKLPVFAYHDASFKRLQSSHKKFNI